VQRILTNVHNTGDEQDTYQYIHCDVFSSSPFAGNSLAVFPDRCDLSSSQMLAITQELRHFETIFLRQEGSRTSARIFDLFEELPFAGHPIIGAACTLHRLSGDRDKRLWVFELINGRTVEVRTHCKDGVYQGCLDQGRPHFFAAVPDEQRQIFAKAFNLTPIQLANLPMDVISTGLRYLVVPVRSGLEKARIVRPDLEDLLTGVGAEFAYLFDVERFEGRHWNNDGILEDVATGSAAGVVGAYALKHGLAQSDQPFILKQGHFMARPSQIEVTPFGNPNMINRVEVAGAVATVGFGEMVAP